MSFEDEILKDLEDEYINSDTLLARNEWDTYYYNKMGIPRVSFILRACNLSVEPLMKWASSLGFRHIDYVQARNKAANKGTVIHNSIEAFIKDKKVPDYYKISDEDVKNALYNGFEGFCAFWNNYRFKDQIAEVKMEQTVVTPFFGGTYDLMITLKDGRNILYDFKTSNQLKYEHFVQLSAYKFALENYYNTPISAMGVLLIDKNTPNCREYLLDFSIQDNQIYASYCQKCFISMTHTFYSCTAVKEKFSELRRGILIKDKEK